MILKWLFRKRKSKTVELFDRGERQLAGWRVLDGYYAGVEYLVGDVSSSVGRLKFTVEILSNPNGLDTDTNAFTELVGNSLTDHMKREHNDYKNWLYRKD